MFYSSYGSFVHKIIEEYYSGELSQQDMSSRFLLGFSDNVLGNRPDGSTVQKYIKQGSQYFTDFKPFPYTPIDIEHKMVFQIDGVPFVGYADYIGDDNGDIVVVDSKSKELKKRSNRKKKTKNDENIDSVLRQLYIYSDGIMQEYGKYPSKLCINCFRTGVMIEEPFNEKDHQEALEWAKSGIESIKNAEEFKPSVEYFKCSNICGVNKDCCYWELR